MPKSTSTISSDACRQLPDACRQLPDVCRQLPDACRQLRDCSSAAAARRWLFCLLAAALGGACGGSEPQPDVAAPPSRSEPGVVTAAPTGPRLTFRFEALQGEPVTSESVAGRFTVIGLVATYDVASSAQARFLTALAKKHVPRLNVVLLVLEPVTSRPMIEAFVGALHIEYPVAFAGDATVAGKGPFEGLNSIPSVVILGPEGRELWRHKGLVDEEQLESELARFETR